MQEVRLANMFYEQRGPMVFSASLHLVLLVVAGIYALVSPKKEPEELVFILSSPPAGGYVEPLPLEALDYESEDVEMPTEDDYVIPERTVLPELPDPVIEEPVVTKPEPPKQKPMNWEEFRKEHNIKEGIKNKRPNRVENNPPKVDVSKLLSGLDNIEISSVSPSEYNSLSQVDQDALGSYVARFKQAIGNAVQSHPFAGQALRVRVRFDIAANGKVSNAQIVDSSGDPEFDRKVLAAFRSVSFFDSPPNNRGYKGIQFNLSQEN